MENKEIQEINVEKELPKTLEEYVIKEIESLKKMNADLAEALRISRALNFKQNEEIETLKNKYIELINNLKEDINPKIAVFSDGLNKHIETNSICEFEEYNNKKYQYYKQIFNLKEEGEEDNE